MALPAPTGGPADLLEVVRRRRSRRNFIPATLGLEDCSNLLAAALPGPSRLGVTVALKTPDLPAGPYRYLPGHHLLGAQPAGGGDPAHRAAVACLNQMWVGQAAMLLLLSAPVEHTAEVSGPRSYRHLMLDAGAAGQRLYLAATALGLGCCGVGAFYDAELAAAMGLPPGEAPCTSWPAARSRRHRPLAPPGSARLTKCRGHNINTAVAGVAPGGRVEARLFYHY